MADIVRYIDSDVSGGLGDGSSWINAYSSMAAWSAAEGTAIAAGDRHLVYCRGATTDLATSALVFSADGWGGDGELLIIGDLPDNPVQWDSSKYKWQAHGINYPFDVSGVNIRLSNLQRIFSGNYASAALYCSSGALFKSIEQDHCIDSRIGNTTTFRRSLVIGSTDATSGAFTRSNTLVIGSLTEDLLANYNSGGTYTTTQSVIQEILTQLTTVNTTSSISYADTAIGGVTTYTKQAPILTNCATESGAGTDPVTVTNWDDEFVDLAANNFALKTSSSLIGSGSAGSNIGVDQAASAPNVDPVLGTPEPDYSEAYGWSGTIDVGENFSDANPGDTLTFSDDNNFAANAGVTFNSATGVFTLDGTLAQGTYNVAVTASDGNGGTYPQDTFTVEITAPVLIVNSVSDLTPQPGDEIDITHSNALDDLTAGDYTVVSNAPGTSRVLIPNPITFVLTGQTYPTINFNTPINIPLTDGTNSDDASLDGIEPPTGTEFAEITSIPANSIYAATPAIQVGHFGHFFNITGNWVIDPATGVVIVDAAGGSFDYTVYNGEWAEPVTYTVAARPSGTVTIDSLVPGREGAVVNFSYPGSDLTGFQYRIDGGSWLAATSPLNITGQEALTEYTLDLVAVNNGRQGDITTVVYTTTDAVDTTPNPFTIASLTGQALSGPAVFAPVTVNGVDAGVDIPVSIEDLTSVGATYAVSTGVGQPYGPETSAPGNVRLNYLVRVTFANADTHLTQRQASLSIGGVQATATSTTLADTVDPVITLIGGNQTLTEGGTWSEPGYSASDNADGDLTSQVQVTGSVNPAVPGTYILSYYVADAAGNETTVTRTVTVNAQAVITPMTQVLTPENLSLDVVGEPSTSIKMFTQSNNRFSVTLQVNQTPVDLSVFSRLVLKLDATTSIDSDTDDGLDWSNGNGEIVLDIGGYLTGKGTIETTLLAYRNGITAPHVLWHPSLASKLRIEKIEL